MTDALSPTAALAHAARLLEAKGFTDVARNDRGDTIYLKRPGSPWHLRLSNHTRTPKQRRRRTDILTSLVIATPRSPDQVAGAVDATLKNFQAASAMRAGQPSAAAARK